MSADLLREDDFHSHFDLRLWRRILSHTRPYLPQLLGLAVSGLVVALVDSALPFITGRIIDAATTDETRSRLFLYMSAYAGMVLLFCFMIWLFIILAGQVTTGLSWDIREKSFARLQELQFAYFDTRPVGWLMSRLTSDCSRLSNLIPWLTLDVFWGIFMLLTTTVMMLILSWPLALTVMLIIPPLAVISIYFQYRLLHSSRQMRKVNSQLTASYNECITGVKTTKSLAREEENLQEFRQLTKQMYRHSARNSLQSAVYLPLVLSLGSMGVGVALWRGGVMLGTSVTLGTLIAFMQYAAQFYIPIQELARRFTEVQMAQAAAERIQSLLDTEPEIKDSPAVRERLKQFRSGRGEGIAEDGWPERIETIEFRNVSFAYNKEDPVLRDFNLKVSAGDTIALVGPTGGGKSTIVSLLCRFYEPTAGEILINGIDYRERSLHWLQSNLGIVLQSPHLFSGTIRENILYGKTDAEEEQVLAAARIANAHQFICQAEKGYETEVGEGGSQLSTGEKQLISLARAVLADPQIFVMDEATSSVDTATEKLIQEGIQHVLQGRISFVIAHRLSTIRNADRILVIEAGQIIEQGTHDELISLGQRYFQLYTSQFSSEKQEEIMQSSS